MAGPAPDRAGAGGAPARISAVTLATADMGRACAFYGALGFVLRYGGPAARFSSFALAGGWLNLTAEGAPPGWWGRVILHVGDVDALYALALARGLGPHAPPRDAEWGERYFHLTDPDGHELSFVAPLPARRG